MSIFVDTKVLENLIIANEGLFSKMKEKKEERNKKLNEIYASIDKVFPIFINEVKNICNKYKSKYPKVNFTFKYEYRKDDNEFHIYNFVKNEDEYYKLEDKYSDIFDDLITELFDYGKNNSDNGKYKDIKINGESYEINTFSYKLSPIINGKVWID